MAAQEDRFAELRSLLQEAPSVRVWHALCAQLDQWEDAPLQEIALPYALGHVQRWPATLMRVAPDRWCDQAVLEAPQPRLALCDALVITDRALRAETIARLIHTPELGALRGLTLNNQHRLNAAALEQVLHTPKLRHLERLAIHHTLHSSLSVRLLAEAPMEALRSLSLVAAYMDDISWSKLAREARWRGTLTALNLSHSRLSADTGFRHLLRGGAPASTLTALTLDHNQLGDTLVEALVEAPRLGALTTLNLRANRISDAAIGRLIRAPHLRTLTSLDLSYNPHLTAQSAQQLASDASQLALEALALDGVGLIYAGARALAQSARLGALHTLSLARARLGDDGARALLESERLPALRALTLDTNHLSDETARLIASAPQSQRLRALSLANNQLTDLGAIALARSPYLSGLTSLSLTGNAISAQGAQALASSPYLSEAARAPWLG